MQIPILFKNDDFVAVNKPAGMSVHNNEDPQNLMLVLQNQLDVPKLFPVHRLDKETSGVQIVAVNSVSARTLADEFQKRSVDKVYVGILRGQLKTAKGVWNGPLSDKAEGRKNPAGKLADRLRCETGFEVLQSTKYFTHCEFLLFTGRQHQIRKHAAMANHPLVGDQRYGDPSYNNKITDLYEIDRMLLHCTMIKILNEAIECPAPQDFERLFQK